MTAEMEIRFTLNGDPVTVNVAPALPVSEFLRDRMDLTGTKVGCGEGECGACTIILDGEAVNSCLVPAAMLDGGEVVTIEGLEAHDGTLHPVQKAFVEIGAVQCGFCTPGMILRTVAFLDKHPDPSAEQIARSIEGNLCRCTGYVKILEAIRGAADAMATGSAGRADR
jgi:aerobic carbon-monoxide dehydrogenase small subunit